MNPEVRRLVEDGLILHANTRWETEGLVCDHCLEPYPCDDRVIYEGLERELGGYRALLALSSGEILKDDYCYDTPDQARRAGERKWGSRGMVDKSASTW